MKRRSLLTGAAALGAYAALQRGARGFGLGRLGAGFGRLGAVGGAGQAIPASLVLPGTPLAVYSSIQLAGYSGPWARVLNASTSVSTDIPFVKNVPSQAAITAARGSAGLTVSILYDQSGNGLNAVQYSGGASFNPACSATNIVNGIQPVTFNGYSSSTTTILTMPSGLTLSSQAASAFKVINPMTSYQKSTYLEFGTASPVLLTLWNDQQGGIAGFDGASNINTPVPYSVRAQMTAVGVTWSASNSIFFVDALTPQNEAAPALRALVGGHFGFDVTNNAFNGSFDEFCTVIYGSTLSNTWPNQLSLPCRRRSVPAAAASPT
jgi:hypothetical protein